jgi:hypothetical protein
MLATIRSSTYLLNGINHFPLSDNFQFLSLFVVFNKIKKLNRYAESPEIIGTSVTQHQSRQKRDWHFIIF